MASAHRAWVECPQVNNAPQKQPLKLTCSSPAHRRVRCLPVDVVNGAQLHVEGLGERLPHSRFCSLPLHLVNPHKRHLHIVQPPQEVRLFWAPEQWGQGREEEEISRIAEYLRAENALSGS